MGGRTIIIDPDDGNVIAGGLPAVVVHEVAHALALLNDEYPYPEGFVYPFEAITNRNCVRNQTTGFRLNGVLYGRTDLVPCSYSQVYRPSTDSLMQGGNMHIPSPKFNVISCGYILNELFPGQPSSNMKKCTTLDTVPVGQ